MISEVTFDEIAKNENINKVDILLSYLSEISYIHVDINNEITKIADIVKQNGLIMADKHVNDRLHIGCAIESECDVIVSMNFKHLVNVNTIRGVRAISVLQCNRNNDIVSPASIIY